LLMQWTAENKSSARPDQFRLTLTHEEIAEMIGTSRETVSRLFSDFKKRQLVQLKGSVLVIRDKPALEKMIQS
jgi:CRP/FNR family cyclic AMP-dependent transcriptional regulator